MLGNNHPHNDGVEAQRMHLLGGLWGRNVNYKLFPHPRDKKRLELRLFHDNHAGIQLLPACSVADLVDVERGRWESRSTWDGHVFCTGFSKLDVIARTIVMRWN